MFWNTSWDPQLYTFATFSQEGTDQNGMAAAVEVLVHLFLMIVSNISCVALVSYFLTTLPTKRNLFTFFDTVLVLVLTTNVDISFAAILCFQSFEHPLPPLVAALNISLLWTTCQLLSTFLCLSFTRMFLIYKPEHFIQLDHEKRFKLVLTLNSILSTVCVLVLLGDTFGPEANFKKLNSLTNNLVWKIPDISFKIFFVSLSGATALAMLTSEVCAWLLRPASASAQSICVPGFIVNNIPFFTINLSIVFAMVVQIVGVFFNMRAPHWFLQGLIVTAILVTNRKAMSHVALKLRQFIDPFTIGNSNMVDPLVSTALFTLPSLIGDAPGLPPTPTTAVACRPFEDTNVSKELQLLIVRGLTRDPLTLPTSARPSEDPGRFLCPVEC